MSSSTSTRTNDTTSPTTTINQELAKNSRYLQELMQELQMMTKIYEDNNSAKFRNSHNLLLREIQRVWSIVFSNDSNINGDTSTNFATPKIFSPTQNTELGLNNLNLIPSSNEMKLKNSGDIKTPTKLVEKKLKVFFPQETETNSNLVGRIIGPRGMTIRQLEKDFDCNLFVRGKGCMRDDEKESRLRGRDGWHHLDDKIHVLIVSKGENDEVCNQKLEKAKARIESLLNNPNDALKKNQLVQLAVIEGTLRE